MKAAAGAAGRAATPGDTGGTAPVSARQTMRAIVQAGYVPPTSCIWRRSDGQRLLAARSSSGSMRPGSTEAPST